MHTYYQDIQPILLLEKGFSMPIETKPLPQTDEELAQQVGEAYAYMAHLKAGGAQEIAQETLGKLIQKGEAMDIIDFYFPDTGSTRAFIQQHNPHPLSQKQEADLQAGIIADFGPPKFG
jgi:hypothetical protein